MDHHLWLHSMVALLVFLAINWVGGTQFVSRGYLLPSVAFRAEQEPFFSLAFRAIAPLVALFVYASALFAAGWDEYVSTSWQIVPLSFGIRVSWNIAWGRSRMLDWRRLLSVAFLSSLIAIAAQESVLNHREYLLPDPKSFGDEIWLALVLFCYDAFSRYQFGVEPTASGVHDYRGNALIGLRGRYGVTVKGLDLRPELEALVFSVMIVENFNRPWLARRLERIKGIVRPRGTYGVMQVSSDFPIDDAESVRRGGKHLVDLVFKVDACSRDSRPEYLSNSEYTNQVLRHAASLYNGSRDYGYEVMEVYREILPHFLDSTSTPHGQTSGPPHGSTEEERRLNAFA